MTDLPLDSATITLILSIFVVLIVIWRVAVRIEGRLKGLDGRLKAIEDNTLLAGYREYQVSAAKNLFDPEENLKKWEDVIKKVLQGEGKK